MRIPVTYIITHHCKRTQHENKFKHWAYKPRVYSLHWQKTFHSRWIDCCCQFHKCICNLIWFMLTFSERTIEEIFKSICALTFTLCDVKLTIADIYWTFTMCQALHQKFHICENIYIFMKYTYYEKFHTHTHTLHLMLTTAPCGKYYYL